MFGALFAFRSAKIVAMCVRARDSPNADVHARGIMCLTYCCWDEHHCAWCGRKKIPTFFCEIANKFCSGFCCRILTEYVNHHLTAKPVLRLLQGTTLFQLDDDDDGCFTGRNKMYDILTE